MVIMFAYFLFFCVASDLVRELVFKLVLGQGLFKISVIIPVFLLLFIDVLIGGFGKSVRNLVNNLCFTVNSNSISWVYLFWYGTPLAATAAIAVNVLVSKILILFVSDIMNPFLWGNPTDPSTKLMTAVFRVPLKLSTLRVYVSVLMTLYEYQTFTEHSFKVFDWVMSWQSMRQYNL